MPSYLLRQASHNVISHSTEPSKQLCHRHSSYKADASREKRGSKGITNPILILSMKHDWNLL